MASLSARPQDLKGKVAVITGATRGIGRAIAMHLGSRGCSILGTCSGPVNLHLINTLGDELATLFKEQDLGEPPFIRGIVADIFSCTCAEDIALALERSFDSKVDIFINNAADPNTGNLGELTVEEISKSLLGNIQTPVLIVDKLVKQKMFQTNSRIIYISSIRSRLPWSGQLMYSAGKSAGESLCRTWSQAFGGREEKVRPLFLEHSSTLFTFLFYYATFHLAPIFSSNIMTSSNSWPARQQTPSPWA
jgi:3-oxoacyl-[acyl-carrier protein] reductase